MSLCKIIILTYDFAFFGGLAANKKESTDVIDNGSWYEIDCSIRLLLSSFIVVV